MTDFDKLLEKELKWIDRFYRKLTSLKKIKKGEEKHVQNLSKIRK